MKARFDLRVDNNLLKDIRLKAVKKEVTISNLISEYILLGIALKRLNSLNDNKIIEGELFQSIMHDLKEEYRGGN